MPTHQRERAKPLSPDDRRHAIIEAVVPLLDPNAGPITTKQIAEAAGIAEGTIFRVFPDKKALFVALAEHVTTPPGSDEELRTALEAASDLRAKVIITVTRMLDRTEKMLVVMHSLRFAMAGEIIAETKPGDIPAPKFLIEANRHLQATLIDLLFEPHRDELSVTPEAAATVLQGLIFGLAHPAMVPPVRFGPEGVAGVFLDGIVERSCA